MTEDDKNIIAGSEIEFLRNALKRNDTERFKTMTMLMKLGIILKNSKVIDGKFLHLLNEQKIKKLKDEMNPGSNPL